MKTCAITNTDLVVSRIAYGCGHLSQPKLKGFGDLSTEQLREALRNAKDALLGAFEDWRSSALEASEIEEAIRIVHTAVDNGINLFDHADVYGWGKCETLFGEVLQRSPGLRERLVIQTKCGIVFAGNVLDPRPGDPHRLDFSREHILKSADASLRRLRSDRIDILLLHRPDALMEPQEVAAAFDDLHRSGKVRYFGVSNHTAGQIELLKTCVRQPLVVNQLHISLAHSYLIADGMELNRDEATRLTRPSSGVAGTLDYCRQNRICIQAWHPMKGGNNAPDLLKPPREVAAEIKRAAALLADIGRRKGVSPAAIALAWLLRHPAEIIPITGSMSPEHIAANCQADKVSLSREEWYELFAAGLGIPSLTLLGVVLPRP